MEKLNIKDIAAACGVDFCGNGDIIINDIVTDSRKVSEGCLFVCLEGEKFDGHSFVKSACEAGAAAVLVHKETETADGVAVIKVKDTLTALGDIAHYYRSLFKIPVIALSGSVGKTTTKDMLAAAFSDKMKVLKTPGNYNNNIGVPLTLFGLDSTYDLAVIEMGMNHFDEIHYLSSITRQDAALLTNIGMSHIENLGSQEGILKAKLEITDYLDEDGFIVLNGDDELLWSKRDLLSCRCIYYGIKNSECDVVASDIVLSPSGVEFDANYNGGSVRISVSLPGEHNVYNALASFCMAKQYGLEDDSIARGLRSFTPSKMRMDIKKAGEYMLINDCYNASPASMEAAIKVLGDLKKTRSAAVLGDMREMGDFAFDAHKKVGEFAHKSGVDVLICTGELGKYICQGAKEAGMSENNIYYFENNAEINNNIKNILKADDCVLVKASRAMQLEEVVNYLEK